MYDTPGERPRQAGSLLAKIKARLAGQAPDGATPLEIVVGYHRRGWSLIPIRAGTKGPACRSWKPYQTNRASESQLRQWFGAPRDIAVAVILGEVSGGLVCRDFDTMAGYSRWKELHPDLATTLPTVATARGRHVYFLGKDRKIVKLADGELRGAGYCLLPPSRHPAGPTYNWLIPLPSGPLPRVDDVVGAGFLDTTDVTERTETTERTEENRGLQRRTEAIERVCSCSPTNRSVISVLSVTLEGKQGTTSQAEETAVEAINDEMERVILGTLPIGKGRRNRQVFELARAIKSVPRLGDAPVDRLEPFVRHWHRVCITRGLIATEPFEETWIDFIHAWPKVIFPKGAEPMVAIFEKAKAGPLPAVASRYESPGVRLLVALCRELQQVSGQNPFYLDCRTAARLLTAGGISDISYVTAWRWLTLLVHHHVVEVVEKGDRGRRKASRYRYLGD